MSAPSGLRPAEPRPPTAAVPARPSASGEGSAATAPTPPAASVTASLLPLVIDLDGTLVRGDLLHESLLRLLVAEPAALLAMPGWLARGKAAFKREVGMRVALDVSRLPYEPALLDWIRAERARGRRIVLCTAADAGAAERVAAHLGLFDEVIASDGQVNISADRKARALVERFGERGFDYAGNARVDVAVWAAANRAVVVNANARVRAAAARAAQVEREFPPPAGRLGHWLRAIRLHQWVKNLLVFLPLVGAHQFFRGPLLVQAIAAFVAFGLCASSVYLVNDLVDLDSDRGHPRKCRRPFAAGLLPVPHGVVAALLLLLGAFGVAAAFVPRAFSGWLAVYLAVTLCYTFWLKRKFIVDSLVLAGLYTLRVLAGGAAVGIAPGFWLLAFSMFLFLNLALVKRYVELTSVIALGGARAAGRDYLVEDLHLVQTMGLASGFSAVLVVALYINGDSVRRLYPHEEAIWIIVPVLLYWISRLWLKAHRGEMDDDPIVFAFRDRVSLGTIGVFFAALFVASLPLA